MKILAILRVATPPSARLRCFMINLLGEGDTAAPAFPRKRRLGGPVPQDRPTKWVAVWRACGSELERHLAISVYGSYRGACSARGDIFLQRLRFSQRFGNARLDDVADR